MCRLVMVGVPEIRHVFGTLTRYVRTRRVISLLFAILACLGLATTFFPATSDVTGTLGVLVAFVAAGIVFLRGAQQLDGRERLAWSGIGVAMLLASSGLAIVAVLSSTGAQLPAFGPLDTFFLVSYVVLCVGIVALPHAEGRWSIRALGLVDGLVGAIAVATVAWVWLLSGYVDLLKGAPPGQRVIAMAYPVLDVALLISILMLSIRRSSFRFDRRLLLFSIGLIIQVFADLALAATGGGEIYTEATPNYLLFIAAGILFLAAASIVHLRPAHQEFADRPGHWTTLLAPYGAAAVVVLVLVWRALQGEAEHLPLLAVATLAVGMLTFARQAVSIRESRYQVDEDRQNLVASISHELRTPLTVIVGMLELMRIGDTRLSEREQKEFLDTVTGQARYMGRIVSDLMLVARDLDGSLQVVPSSFDLDRLVRSAVFHVEGSQAVELRLPALTVEVDGERIQQAIANLVSNAIKYGDGQVLVTAERGVNLVIEVHDDGPGVPTKYELVIWNRFERGPRNLDSRVPGSGIGLAIVDKVARAHGGHAGYRRSEILGGSCFFVSIPVNAVALSESHRDEPDATELIAV